jgi:hypothetical protein
LGHENYFGFWDELEDLASRLDSIQSREADVEHDQIGAEFFRFLDCG